VSPLQAFFALLTGACVACSGPKAAQYGRVMSIQKVIDHINELNGRSVRVEGYLGTCAGYDCLLFASDNDRARWERVVSAMVHRKKPTEAEPPMLGIGSGEHFDFDAKAAPFNNSYVIISGTVTNGCRYHGLPGCTDRTTDLKPISIERWSPSAKVHQGTIQ
jgi:hypothetical protein